LRALNITAGSLGALDCWLCINFFTVNNKLLKSVDFCVV
jgi:hypothetical protein